MQLLHLSMIFSAWLVSSGIFKDVFDFDNSTWYHVFFSFFFQQNTKHCFIFKRNVFLNSRVLYEFKFGTKHHWVYDWFSRINCYRFSLVISIKSILNHRWITVWPLLYFFVRQALAGWPNIRLEGEGEGEGNRSVDESTYYRWKNLVPKNLTEICISALLKK